MEEQTIKQWLKNDKFVNFLAKKGIDVADLLRYYRFDREDKTRIRGDFLLLKSYYENFTRLLG